MIAMITSTPTDLQFADKTLRSMDTEGSREQQTQRLRTRHTPADRTQAGLVCGKNFPIATPDGTFAL